jgi:hypothetical protein
MNFCFTLRSTSKDIKQNWRKEEKAVFSVDPPYNEDLMQLELSRELSCARISEKRWQLQQRIERVGSRMWLRITARKELGCAKKTSWWFEVTVRPLWIRFQETTSGECKRLREGRAVAEAVSRRLPTAEAGVCVRAAFGVCGGQSGTGAGFLRVLSFRLPIIPQISPSP